MEECKKENGVVSAIKTGPETREKLESPMAQQLRQALLEEFGSTSLAGKYLPHPPIRGPFGEAEIELKAGAVPVSRPPFRMTGERRDALIDLVNQAKECGKLEEGKGPWNTPAFPVPKKTPHTFRLVQDLRPQNEATVKDGHPSLELMIFSFGKVNVRCGLHLTLSMDFIKCRSKRSIGLLRV